MVKALQRSRCRGVFRLVGCVICSEVWVSLNNVVIIGEYKELRGPVVTVGLEHWRDTSRLDLVIVGFEICPGLWNANTNLLEDLLVVEDTARGRVPDRHSKNSSVLRYSGKKRISDIRNER